MIYSEKVIDQMEVQIAEQLSEIDNLKDRIAELEKDGKVCATCGGLVYDPVLKQTKPLSDEELNKAFDYYCKTDEGVLRFNYELCDEWKKEQLIRWKEAFKKASEK